MRALGSKKQEQDVWLIWRSAELLGKCDEKPLGTDMLITQSGDTPGPLSFALPFELESELAKEINRRGRASSSCPRDPGVAPGTPERYLEPEVPAA